MREKARRREKNLERERLQLERDERKNVRER